MVAAGVLSAAPTVAEAAAEVAVEVAEAGTVKVEAVRAAAGRGVVEAADKVEEGRAEEDWAEADVVAVVAVAAAGGVGAQLVVVALAGLDAAATAG